MDFTASIELDSPFPTRDEDADALVTSLAADVDVYGGVVARSLNGRVRVVFTVQAEDLRVATHTALAVLVAAGRRPYTVEVFPAEEFERRADMVVVPELVSVPQAAELLGVSRQRALELARGGKLDAVKVGDTWVIPRVAVINRAVGDGTFWTGTLLPVNVVSDTGQLIEPDALLIEELPLPVHDEQQKPIGLIRGLRETDTGWTASGRVHGLEPGEYAVAPLIDGVAGRQDGDVYRITRGVIRGVTVLTTAGREPSFPESRIRVGDLTPREPIEVLSYQ